jgi:multiple sugar transport system substrate-binding protein
MALSHLGRWARSPLFAIIIALTLLAVGCTVAPPATTGQGENQAAAPAAEKVTVVYWGHDFTPRVELDKKYIAAFMKDNPNITVDYVVTPGQDYDTKLATAIAAGTGPDLFAQYDTFTGQFHAAGALVPVDFLALGFGSQKELTDQYVSAENTLGGALFKGELYGIPNEVSIYGCFLNNQLWKEAGLDPVKDFPKTYEELVPIAEKLTKRDDSGKLVQRGFDFMWLDPTYTLDYLIVWARQFGVEIIDAETNTAHLDSPEAEMAMQFIVDWANKYKLGGPGYQESRTAFQTGTMAMECTFGSWAVDLMVQNKIDYTIQMQPLWAGAKVKNYATPYAYFHMVSVKSPDNVKQAAWKLAWYLDSHPEEYLKAGGLLQPRKTLIESQTYKDLPNLNLFLDEMSTSAYAPPMPGYSEIVDSVVRARDRCVTQGMDVKTSLAQAQQEVTAILDKQNK